MPKSPAVGMCVPPESCAAQNRTGLRFSQGEKPVFSERPTGDRGQRAGMAAGYYVDANNILHGYLRSSDGTVTEFDPPGSIWTVVWDLNANGVVTGTYMDQSANFHGFLRTP